METETIYHFVGIKGSGMSALALILHGKGYRVQGSDVETYFFTQKGLDDASITIMPFNEANITPGLTVIAGNAFPDSHEEIASALMDRLGRGVTLLHGEGGYTGDSKKIVYCVVTRLEVDKLKQIALDKDENAFVSINPVHDIVGGRFKKKAIH